MCMGVLLACMFVHPLSHLSDPRIHFSVEAIGKPCTITGAVKEKLSMASTMNTVNLRKEFCHLKQYVKGSLKSNTFKSTQHQK